MKIVVFDFGFGGDMFAEKLEAELPIADVTRVIDWRHLPDAGEGEREVRALVEDALVNYIGRVDVIVLASYDATVSALKYLRIKYPEQLFVGMSWPIIRVGEEKQVVVLTTDLVRRSREFRRLRRSLDGRVTVQVCDWTRQVDDGEMSEQKIRAELARTRKLRPQIVVLGCTNLLDVKKEIEGVYFGAAVLDGYAVTIRKVCRMLRIRAPRR